jgi:uncharacterized membrane protein
MAAVSWAEKVAALAVAALVMVGLSCTAPRSTEPDVADPASAKSGGTNPTVTSVDPAEAPQSTTLVVRVLGSNYDQGSTVEFARAGVVDPSLHVNSTTYLSNTELLANVSIAADAAPVSYDVVVTSSRGKKGIGTERFAVVVPVQLLSAPDGGSSVSGVSDNGLMVGRIATTCEFAAAPALWNQLGQLTALPLLPGTCGGIARDINSAGVAVGSAYAGSSSAGDVRWVPSAGSYKAEALPPLPNGSSAGAWAINEAGSVVGANIASVLKAGSTTWMLLQRPSGATSCLGSSGINNLDAVAARCTISGRGQGVYWASPAASPVLLPLPSGATDVYVRGINDAGVIVGWTSISTGKNQFVNRATRWTPSGGSWTTEFLGDYGLGSAAFAINDAGQIVGQVQSRVRSNRPAYWSSSGTLRELEGTGDALGLTEPAAGPMVAGNASGAAALWRP